MFSFSNTSANRNATDVTNAGPSISSTAIGKVYGWFIDQLKILNPDSTTIDLVSKYPHPVMCVIGCESTGKSATIESICKVPIFPSDTGICTRCPIKVVLMPSEPGTPNSYEFSFKDEKCVYTDKNLSDLKAAIANIFLDVTKDSESSHGYSAEVITIIVHRPDVIRMDFVDLPGIVSYPPEAKAFTLSLSQKYIVDPACFILCVANATTPRLTSYEPIACISAANACERSIIVLPMVDKLSPRDFETHLLNRVTMVSDELQGHPFNACCAVVNRSNVSDCSLTKQARREQDWFQKNILKPMERDLNNCNTAKTVEAQTHCATMRQTMNQASARMGIDMLLRVTNEKYEEHIKERWMPRTLDEISKDIATLTAQRDQLGVLPSEENLQQFKDYYSQHIHEWLQIELMNPLCDSFSIKTDTELLQVLKSADAWTIVTQLYQAQVHVILQNLDKLSAACPNYNELPLKWGRFESTYIRCILVVWLNILNTQLQPHFHVLYPKIHFERIMKRSPETLMGLLKRAFEETVKLTCVEALTLEEALVENKATATQRAELTRKIEVHQGVQRALQEKVLTMSSQP